MKLINDTNETTNDTTKKVIAWWSLNAAETWRSLSGFFSEEVWDDIALFTDDKEKELPLFTEMEEMLEMLEEDTPV